MRLSSAFAGVFLAVSAAAVQSSVNQSSDFDARVADLRKRSMAEGHAVCAADISVAAPYIKGRNATQAVIYHRDQSIALMGKEFFASAYGDAYEKRIEILDAALQRDASKDDKEAREFQAATKSFVKDVEGCLRQVPPPLGME